VDEGRCNEKYTNGSHIADIFLHIGHTFMHRGHSEIITAHPLYLPVNLSYGIVKYDSLSDDYRSHRMENFPSSPSMAIEDRFNFL
jgi:hypothetical protein